MRPLSARRSRGSGFALVITMTLLVLLALLATGLLGLSAIFLRSSRADMARAEARANARLALMMALGQLQKEAGPDQRVTASADILGREIAQPRLTGVWDSWQIKAETPPSAADYSRSSKNQKFRTWLVSSGDPAAAMDPEYARREPGGEVTLWGEGALGSGAAHDKMVRAQRVAVGGRGGMAWATLDEGVKARIDTPWRKEAPAVSDKIAQLGSGVRPRTDFIGGLEGLARTDFEINSDGYARLGKGITRESFVLAGEQGSGGTQTALRALLHDVTTWSRGLFTDTAHGGLRRDFQLLANNSKLPEAFVGRGIYHSLLGLDPSLAVSDPRWESLHEYARVYKDQITSSGGRPHIVANTPKTWKATKLNTPSSPLVPDPPEGVLLLPSVVKVQMLFSLIARDLYGYPAFPAGRTPPVVPANAPTIHGPQGDEWRGTKYDYDLQLLYTPVVTLHNPYNVPMEFRKLRVEFYHVPFSMQVFRNGEAQSRDLIPLETMYAGNENSTLDKVFGMNLKTKNRERPGGTTFVLLPGEVKTFSPYIDPNRTYAQDLGNRQFWDIYVDTGLTNNIDAIPGWRGDGIGFSCDWLCGGKPMDTNRLNGHWASCIGLARDDQVHVLFAPLADQAARNKFSIRISGSTGTSSATRNIGAIEINYQRPTALQDILLGRRKNLRYPSTGAVTAIDMLDHATRRIGEIVNAKPFALLSVQAKTTSGGRDASGYDGRQATKPFAFAHANIGVSTQALLSEGSASQSHEFDIQLLDLGQGTSNVIQIDEYDRSNFLTGHTSFYGSKFGVMYELPLAPVQTLAGLNGANPGGSSGYLPRFARPIGNSWAHPLLAPDKIIDSGAINYSYLDHSFLLNLALTDRFYFSGLGDQVAPFGNGKTPDEIAGDFIARRALDDPRLEFRAPDGRPAEAFRHMVGEADAYTKIGAWQMMRGAFNINSTSVPAWTAMLASVHDAEAFCHEVNPATGDTTLKLLGETDEKHARISRFALPNSKSEAAGAEPGPAYWMGPREYQKKELENLAENIVEQVRERGPFLSLAEFVNRQLGHGAAAQRGALQQAIENSGLNGSLADMANAGYEIDPAQVADLSYANPEAGAGPSYQGAPGYLSQEDLLKVLGNAATARSDTFLVRAYGESLDAAGQILATAVCEAVVQRYPEWIDPADSAVTFPTTRKANEDFGRRFEIVSFRWLNPLEI